MGAEAFAPMVNNLYGRLDQNTRENQLDPVKMIAAQNALQKQGYELEATRRALQSDEDVRNALSGATSLEDVRGRIGQLIAADPKLGINAATTMENAESTRLLRQAQIQKALGIETDPVKAMKSAFEIRTKLIPALLSNTDPLGAYSRVYEELAAANPKNVIGWEHPSRFGGNQQAFSQYLADADFALQPLASRLSATTPRYTDVTVKDENGNPAIQKAGYLPGLGLSGLTPVTEAVPKTAPQKDTGTTEDIRFRNIQTKLNLGQPVSEEDVAWAKAYKTSKGLSAEAYATARGRLGNIQVLDTYNGNRPTSINPEERNRAMTEEPDRYVLASGGEKALKQTALLSDIHGAISDTRKSLYNMPDFTAAQAAEISFLMKSPKAGELLSPWIRNNVGQTITTEQAQYIINLNQLVENAMAMRSVLGAGQGSDELRDAIKATLPNAASPTKQYANMQLDAFERQIKRLEAGVPKVKLRDLEAEKTQQSAPTIQTKTQRQIARTGTDRQGRKVVVYNDGSWEYGK